MKYDVAIIGSGLGGLECAYILSKKGYNVCVLEKNPVIGGCLQTFKRGGVTFDTGFHFVGGLDKGQSLYGLFNYFDLLNLPWQKLDEDAFAEVIIKDNAYLLASGHERFIETLTDKFPHQRSELANYVSLLKNVGNNILNSFQPENSGEFSFSNLFSRSAYEFLENTVTEAELRNVLSGISLTMELNKEKLPLYVYSQINNSFIQSSWRLKGGGSLIADKLADSIRSMGGTILTKAAVTRLVEENGIISAVEYNNGEQIQAKYVISNLHPALTLSLIPQSEHIRKIFRKRITNLPNTFGMFTVHLKLKENTVPYVNRNVFIYSGDNVWEQYKLTSQGKPTAALVSYYIPENAGKYADHIDILTPMLWEEVEQWSDSRVGKRGEDYLQFKQRKAEECIDMVTGKIPALKGNIEKYYTSTPLTYRDYTGTWNGSAYGIQKDCTNPMYTMLAPQMQIPNLLLTGQNLNLHGILGVSMTSFFTCARITGMDTLLDELRDKFEL